MLFRSPRNPTLVGFLGYDDHSRQLSALLEQEGVTNACVTTSVPCVTKIRIIGGHQQIVRADFDSRPSDFSEEDYQKLKARLAELIPFHDLVIVSDYAKGVCRDDVCRLVIQSAGSKPVLVDPKHNSWTKYSGASLLKPNVKELSEVAGRPVPNDDLGPRHIERQKRLDILLRRHPPHMQQLRPRQMREHVRPPRPEPVHIHTTPPKM